MSINRTRKSQRIGQERIDTEEAEERQKVDKRMKHYREMADQQVQMIMESMLTLKKVDYTRASIFLIVDTENSQKTDEMLNQIYRDAITNSGPDQ